MTESQEEPERDEVPEGADREEQAQQGRIRQTEQEEGEGPEAA